MDAIEGRLEATKENRIDVETFERYKAIEKCMKQANERSAKQYNKRHLPSPKLEVGSKVFLSTKNLSTGRPSPKLEARFIGPYKLTAFIGKNAVKLDLPPSIKTSPIVHISRIEPAYPNQIPGRVQPPPPPVVVNGEEEYVVERIVDSKRKKSKLVYKVEWRGYTGPEQIGKDNDDSRAEYSGRSVMFNNRFGYTVV
nr:hypothetical protein L204_05473 [Cryptococcus depauperatus CBS 7855]